MTSRVHCSFSGAVQAFLFLFSGVSSVWSLPPSASGRCPETPALSSFAATSKLKRVTQCEKRKRFAGRLGVLHSDAENMQPQYSRGSCLLVKESAVSAVLGDDLPRVSVITLEMVELVLSVLFSVPPLSFLLLRVYICVCVFVCAPRHTPGSVSLSVASVV